jgi:uncharacterized protein YutE (UPF0331/DUF86 family)
MIDDILINKSAIIRRCLARISDEFKGDPERLRDFTVQDSVVLNLLRACEASIDLAMHIVAEHSLGVPQSSRDAFVLLEKAGLLQDSSASAMKRMCGFRNIAVHSYQEIEMPVLTAILQNQLPDFEDFLRQLEGDLES